MISSGGEKIKKILKVVCVHCGNILDIEIDIHCELTNVSKSE